jgi:hypothetical protein
MPPYHPLRDGAFFAPVHKSGLLVDLVDDRWRRDTLPVEPVPLPAGTLLASDEQLFDELAQVISEDAEYCWDDAEINELTAVVGDWRSLRSESGPDALPGASGLRPGEGTANPSSIQGEGSTTASAIWASPAWRTTQQRQALLSQWSAGQPSVVPRTLRMNAMAALLWRRHRRTAGLDLNLESTHAEQE